MRIRLNEIEVKYKIYGPKRRKFFNKCFFFLPLPIRVHFLESTSLNWAVSVPTVTYYVLISSVSYPQFNSYFAACCGFEVVAAAK